jgi:hypothetical protein
MLERIASDATAGDRPATRRPAVRWIIVVVIALLVTVIVGDLARSRAAADSGVPQDAAIEAALGVRFSRVAVVGDGGLIIVSYVVLDSEKATRFQSDRVHAPVLVSEARNLSTQRVSLMKQGHNMRPGQTYYLVYENTGGALRPDERVSIETDSLQLRHVPVL